VAVGVLLALYFLYKRYWRELAIDAVSLGLSGLIFLYVSHIFMRPRPFLLFDKPIWSGSPNIPGFPSGHTLSIAVCCGLLMYLLVPRIKSSLGKTIAVAIGVLIMLYVGFSRLYLGDHYLTDVIAGYALGTAWLGFACTSVELVFRRIVKRRE
jgi:membrane-associated phospholipid phosphatase